MGPHPQSGGSSSEAMQMGPTYTGNLYNEYPNIEYLVCNDANDPTCQIQMRNSWASFLSPQENAVASTKFPSTWTYNVFHAKVYGVGEDKCVDGRSSSSTSSIAGSLATQPPSLLHCHSLSR